MSSGQLLAPTAAAAGYFSIQGFIEKGNGDTLNLPEGMVNVGGNGHGFIIDKKTNWNPTDGSNNDGTIGTLSLGDDVYIYAVRDMSGVATWVASRNSTVPDGSTAAESRKIGGFHWGRVRGIANRYDTAYNPVTQIVPNSVWDLTHRPTCDPTGMAEVVPGHLWADIYLNSEGAGVWPENIPVSRFGATPIKDDVYARVDFHQLAGNAGKRIPTLEEFYRYAEGCLEGAGGNNNYAWSATSNAGPTTTGTVAKALSQYNIVDTAGNLWEWLDEYYDRGNGSYAWSTSVVDVGKDATENRGAVNHSSWRSFVGGGRFGTGARAGARALNNANPWYAGGNVGLRCVCDAL